MNKKSNERNLKYSFLAVDGGSRYDVIGEPLSIWFTNVLTILPLGIPTIDRVVDIFWYHAKLNRLVFPGPL